MRLLPNNSSMITFFVLLGFLCVAGYFYFTDERETGIAIALIGGIPMLLLLVKNYFKRPGQ